MIDLDNCRLYVCKGVFADCDECIKFNKFEQYQTWLKNTSNIGAYSFQPVCHVKEIFDKMVLTYRNKKARFVTITDCSTYI